MNKYLKTFFFLLCLGHLHAQQTFNITTSFGVDVMMNVVETDSGYYTSISSGQPVLPRRAVLCFYDTTGNLIWSRQYGDSLELFEDFSLLQDADHNFIMGAYHAEPFNSGFKHKFALRKVKSNGDSLWLHTYEPDTSKDYYGFWVLPTKDGGFLLSGQISDTADANFYVLKTDSGGVFQWQYELTGIHYDGAYDGAQTINNNYLIVGWTRSFGNGNVNNRDAIVVCLDSTGNFKWKKTFGVSNISEGFYRITQTINNDFLISGEKYIVGQYGNAGVWKIDSAGNLIWQKYYPTVSNVSVFYGIHELADGNIVAVGSDRDTSTMDDKGWIVILDSLGNIIKERKMSVGNSHCIFNDVKQTADGGYVIAGYVFGGPNGEDGWLVKLDSNLCDVAGCAITTSLQENNTQYKQEENFLLYPNPCKETLFIKPDAGINILSATVFDITGKQIKTDFLNGMHISKISTADLSSGVYLLKIKTETAEKVIRFVKH